MHRQQLTRGKFLKISINENIYMRGYVCAIFTMFTLRNKMTLNNQNKVCGQKLPRRFNGSLGHNFCLGLVFLERRLALK